MVDLDKSKLPRHVAIIMDGNGRWAQARGKKRLDGHRAGADSGRNIIKSCRRLGIKYLTVYTFSEENWQRPQAEVSGLMRLLNRHLQTELEELHQNGVRINAVGALSRLPKPTRKFLEKSMEKTKNNKDLVATMALSYGGRQEIVDACRHIASECRAGRIEPEDVDEAFFQRHLYDPDLPDPDLLIRTGGDSRVSNFLLWQIAYTELYVTNTYWPDFREAEFHAALADFQQRQRRFGKTGDQVIAEQEADKGADP